LHAIQVLERMRPLEHGRSRALVREEEELRRRRAPIEGQILAIDPGEPGAGGDPTHAVAEALRDELASMGAAPSLLRGRDEPLGATERAKVANEMGASTCVSIELATGLPEAAGPTVSYFGSDQTHSPGGMLLAQLILEEVEAALGVRGRLQRLSISMLRETRMPAVQVEPAFITNEHEAEVVDDPEFASLVGRAIAVGVKRFFAG
jgi:N-acetylmuramoyl-L-alanine amidase